jgi:hypothetical protein
LLRQIDVVQCSLESCSVGRQSLSDSRFAIKRDNGRPIARLQSQLNEEGSSSVHCGVDLLPAGDRRPVHARGRVDHESDINQLLAGNTLLAQSEW